MALKHLGSLQVPFPCSLGPIESWFSGDCLASGFGIPIGQFVAKHVFGGIGRHRTHLLTKNSSYIGMYVLQELSHRIRGGLAALGKVIASTLSRSSHG